MKLIDFKNFKPFQEIFKKMNITDKDFIEIESKKIEIEIKWGKISNEGLKVKNLDMIIINEDHTLSYSRLENKKISLYIRDRSRINFDKYKGPKFHIAACETIKDDKGKPLKKYHVIQRKDNIYPINITGPEDEEVHIKLKVCKNCLKLLNYKNYNSVSRDEQEEIVEKFDFEEFTRIYEKYDKDESSNLFEKKIKFREFY